MPYNIPYPNSPNNKGKNEKITTYKVSDALHYIINFTSKTGMIFNRNVLSENQAEVPHDFFFIFRGFEYPLMNHASDEEIFDIIKPHYDLSISITNRKIEAEFLWTSLSYVFKYPGLRNGVFVILSGPSGAGKNMFLNVFGHIAEPYGNLSSSFREITTRQCAYRLENKIIVICPHISDCSPSPSIMQKLKTIMTDSTLYVKEKYIPAHETPNVSNFFGATNCAFPVLLERDDKRFVIIGINGSMIKNTNFFKNHSELISTKRFRSALLTYCIRKDVGKAPLSPLHTELKEDLIIYNSRTNKRKYK
jgi:hypothetical protein